MTAGRPSRCCGTPRTLRGRSSGHVSRDSPSRCGACCGMNRPFERSMIRASRRSSRKSAATSRPVRMRCDRRPRLSMTVAIARMSATAHTTPTGSHMSLTVARFRPLRAAETGVRGLQLRFDRLREEPDCDGSESQDGLTGDNHELILPFHVVPIAEWTQRTAPSTSTKNPSNSASSHRRRPARSRRKLCRRGGGSPA